MKGEVPTVVVGVDGSAGGEQTVRWAAAEAGRLGADLRIVHAYDEQWLVDPCLGMPGLAEVAGDRAATVVADAELTARSVAPRLKVRREAVAGKAAAGGSKEASVGGRVTMSTRSESKVLAAVRAAADSTTADRVFGSPVIADGVVLLPVARISGGGGRGAGPATENGGPEGAGGGFGTAGRGLGVFVIGHGKVTWRPAVDVNRIVLGGQLVAVTALLVLRGIVRSRRATHPNDERSCG